MERITPEVIYTPPLNGNILIGTNESGIHGAGIAKVAKYKWGAIMGQGFGPMGFCFGLPTKDWSIRTLPLPIINQYVNRYIGWVKLNKDKDCYVTKIGCGLAGLEPKQIAPMFKECLHIDNVWLPLEFIKIINNRKTWKYKPFK